MAIPKVFVSSTCYDLQEERAQLERFITNYGFTPVLSEYSGVYYDIDAHTHESCINEVAHCDMFVLIISGRYGGKIIDGQGESITQAEYNKARELGLPVFTFVKADVSSAQHYFKENVRAKDESFAKEITYPAIEKQSDAVSIFSFIDSVHRASTNNGIETYHSFTDIENHLKKQWAGLFFSFLQKRKEQEKVEAMVSILDKLAGSSSKLEALVGSLHDKELGEGSTEKLVKATQIHDYATKFFDLIIKRSEEAHEIEEHIPPLFSNTEVEQTLNFSPKKGSFTDYLDALPIFRLGKHEGLFFIAYSGSVGLGISKEFQKELQYLYDEGVLLADQNTIKELIKNKAKNWTITD